MIEIYTVLTTFLSLHISCPFTAVIKASLGAYLSFLLKKLKVERTLKLLSIWSNTPCDFFRGWIFLEIVFLDHIILLFQSPCHLSGALCRAILTHHRKKSFKVKIFFSPKYLWRENLEGKGFHFWHSIPEKNIPDSKTETLSCHLSSHSFCPT